MEPDTRQRDRLIALFLLGLLLFNPLVMRVADIQPPAMMFGIPSLYLFAFAAWAALITLMALVVERTAGEPEDDQMTPEGPWEP